MNGLDVPLRALDACFEGGVPATLCTSSSNGVPNLSFLSVVHRVDDAHVALSFQFFRKTKRNLAENPQARLMVIEPSNAAEFRLRITFVRTETQGAVYERLAASLSAIASQTGMKDTFSLRGADIYRVTACERVDNGVSESLPTDSLEQLTALSRSTAMLARCTDLNELLSRALDEAEASLGHPHVFVMAADPTTKTLFSIASRGYSPSGVGAELPYGEGLVGMAAERRVPIRVANMSRERVFAEAVRSQGTDPASCGRVIAMPGLARTESELVVPLLAQDELLGVMCLQSPAANAFGRVQEELAVVFAHQLASCMARFEDAISTDDEAEAQPAAPVEAPSPLSIRHYTEDDSVFINNEYLIKGVAGRILWLLLCAHEQEGRSEFTNRELRLDSRLGLPPIKDNLETRLIMLRKRLEERCPQVVMLRTGRGRFALQVGGELRLESV